MGKLKNSSIRYNKLRVGSIIVIDKEENISILELGNNKLSKGIAKLFNIRYGFRVTKLK